MSNPFGPTMPPMPGSPPIPGAGAEMIAGPQPGMVYIRALGQWVDMKSWNQEPIYDTENITTPVAAGDEYIFFRNSAFPTGVRKDFRHTNMVAQQQLPSGWHATIYMMSVHLLYTETAAGSGVFTTPEDAIRMFYNGVVRFRTGNQKDEKEAPMGFWPSPLGLTGSIERTGPAVSTVGTLNNGVASLGAVVPLDLTIELSNELTIEGRIRFPGAIILDNDVQLQFVLHTYMSKPLR